MASLPAEGDAEIEVVIGVIGGEPHRFAERGLGIGLESLRFEGHAEIGVDPRVVRTKRGRPRIGLRFLRPVALASAHRGKPQPGCGVVAIHAQGAAECRRRLGEPTQPVQRDTVPPMPEPALRIEAARVAPRRRRLAMPPQSPQGEAETAVEPGQTGPLTDGLAIARGRFPEPSRAPQGIGEVNERAKPARVVAMGVGQSARRLVESTSGEEENAQALAGDGVTRGALERHAVSGLGLGVAPLTRQRSREGHVRVGQRGRDVGGRTEGRFLLGEPPLPPVHEPETQMGEGVAWLEAHRLAVGRAGLRPQPLPFQGEPELEMGLDRAWGQIERRAQSGGGLGPAALLE